MLRWDSPNLSNHWRKHPAGKDLDCWKDILSSKMPVSRNEYEKTSIEVVEKAWLQYEAEARDVGASNYSERRVYYVDDRLIETVTNLEREVIIACWHDHWHSGGKHVAGED